jgi:hypothetical protein
MPQSLGRFDGKSTSSVSVGLLVGGGTPLSAIEVAIASAVGRRIGVGLVNPLTLVVMERQAAAPKNAVEKVNFMVLLLLLTKKNNNTTGR